MFNNIRHNLDGTAYNNGTIDDTTGISNDSSMYKSAEENCGAGVFLCGYELTKDLDFTEEASYENNTINNDWRPLDADNNPIESKDAVNDGFDGIIDFNAIFDGNGHTISNLYSRSEDTKAEARIQI